MLTETVGVAGRLASRTLGYGAAVVGDRLPHLLEFSLLPFPFLSFCFRRALHLRSPNRESRFCRQRNVGATPPRCNRTRGWLLLVIGSLALCGLVQTPRCLGEIGHADGVGTCAVNANFGQCDRRFLRYPNRRVATSAQPLNRRHTRRGHVENPITNEAQWPCSCSCSFESITHSSAAWRERSRLSATDAKG